MEKINGRIISSGIGMGIPKALYGIVDVDKIVSKRINILDGGDIQKELDVFKKAANDVCDYYASLYKNDKSTADIFEALSQLAMDEELTENVRISIEENLHTAEYAVYFVSRNHMKTLETLDDDYIKQRARDIEEIADKIILKVIDIKDNANIDNKKNIALNNDLPHILIVDRLLPEMLINDKCINLKGVVARECAENSHAAIIARIKNIPVITGINIDVLKENDYVIIDDRDSILIIDPDETSRSYYDKLIQDSKNEKKALEKYRDIEVIGRNRKHIKVCANAAALGDIKVAKENGAEGIGLLRTEILFMDRETAPTEEEQFAIFCEAAKMLEGKPLTIRVFDAGMDKPLKFMKVTEESFSERGVRLLLGNVDIFKIQLRAIYRAAVYGNISVMFPMISSVDELSKVQKILRGVKEQLDTDDIPFKDVKVGIMVETPSAVEQSDILTKAQLQSNDDYTENIDFVSIGTNDLIQYTFSKDRISEHSTKLSAGEYDKLFSMIKMTVDNAHKNNCKVSVCGELAGDLNFTDKFIEAGVDELSVAPSKILLLRKQIISLL